MVQLLTCSQCQAQLSVPDDMLGKYVRCPKCSLTFTAVPPEPTKTGPPPLPPEEPRSRFSRADYDRRDDPDEDDRHDVSFRRRPNPNWGSVAGGLHAMFVGTLIVMVTAAVCFVVIVVVGLAESGGGRHNQAGAEALAAGMVCIGMLVAMGGTVTNLIGKIMCLSAPDGRTRGFMIGHLITLAVCGVLGAILFVAFVAFNDAPVRGNPAGRHNLQVTLAIVGALLALVYLASSVFLSRFWKEIAQTFEEHALATSCAAYIVFQVFWLLGVCALAMLSLALDPSNNFQQEGKFTAWVIGLLIVGGGGGLIALFWSLFLLRGCRQTIRQARETSRRKYAD